MKISYCVSTKNRGELLDKSLFALANQEFDKKEYEVIVVDDNSQENIYGLCRSYRGKMNIKYLRLEHGLGWRDSAIGLNFALRRATGDIWVATHPEIIISSIGLKLLYEIHFGKHVVRFVGHHLFYGKLCLLMPCFWLTETEIIKKEDWLTLKWKDLLQQYSLDYRKHYNGKIGHGFSNFVCVSMQKEAWQELGGFYEFCSWGSVDPNLASRRHYLRINDVVIDKLESWCLHQNHPFSLKKKIGQAQLESRPLEETYLPNLSKEHEEQMKHEIVKEQSWQVL